MRLPDLVAYQAAVQNPATAFADPELRGASVVIGRLGLPRAVTGNFAVTYELRGKSQRWAVRCFHREASDRASRYAAISRALAGTCEGPLVPIDYFDNGVRVGQSWYPITRMPWIDGHPLNAYIEQNLNRPDAIRALERRFRALVADLRRRGMAHGDLQHGNILVDQAGGLRLVDYDGMFVPALAGRGASETGDPNYQHPRRTNQFDAQLDRFSAVVIVIALRALVAEPDLWRTYNTGDNLLFRRTDFADPSHSALLRDLRRIPSLQHLADRFAQICARDYVNVPTIDEFFQVERKRAAKRSWTLHRATLQTAIAFSSDHALIATGERDGKIHVRECQSGRTRSTLQVRPSVMALAFTPSGEVRAVTDDEATLCIAERRFHPSGHVRAAALSPDAAWLCALDARGVVRCWSADTGRALGSLTTSGATAALAACASSRRVALASRSGGVDVYRLRDGQRLHSFKVGRGVTCLSLADNYLAVGQASGCVSVFRLDTGELAFAPLELAGPLECLALSADCTRLGAATRDGAICVRPLRSAPARGKAVAQQPARIVRMFDWLRRVAL